MRTGKLLAASGLALMAGPFCLSALAQSYVDVEAERAAAKRDEEAAVTSSAPAPSQPSTTTTRSYGLGTAPAAADPYASQPGTGYSGSSLPPTTGIAPATTTRTTAPAAAGATPGPADAGAANLLYQVQQLQQEVMRLNGLVEEQAFEIRTLKQQSLERYVDLDRRVSALSGGAAATGAAAAGGSAPGSAAGGLAVGSGATAGSGGGAAQPGEADAYRAAYALVRSQQFDQAVTAFNEFLESYPAGKFAPNAHYWLGELYLVITPPDPELARQSFMLLVDQYPDNAKVPDALYKLGRVQFMKGNRDRSREFLDRVISEHGDTSAARLAREFIDQNF
jgi:tol-pal system protein YbgF